MEMVRLSINYMGNDHIIETDIDTATLLLNDPESAAQYMEQLLNKNKVSSVVSECVPLGETSTSASISGSRIWSSKLSTDIDKEATDFFLKLREKYDKQFSDKKSSKIMLWNKIASEMNGNGFFVGDGKEGAERCRQKFCNMQKQYINFINHMKTTGSERKDPPSFYDEMHSLLGNKDKVNPQNLQDTEEECSEVREEREEECLVVEKTEAGPSQRDPIKHRFSNVKASCKPKKNEMCELLAKHQEEEIAWKKNIENLLIEQSQDRKKIVSLFEQLVQNNRKRRRGDDSESD